MLFLKGFLKYKISYLESLVLLKTISKPWEMQLSEAWEEKCFDLIMKDTRERLPWLTEKSNNWGIMARRGLGNNLVYANPLKTWSNVYDPSPQVIYKIDQTDQLRMHFLFLYFFLSYSFKINRSFLFYPSMLLSALMCDPWADNYFLATLRDIIIS